MENGTVRQARANATKGRKDTAEGRERWEKYGREFRIYGRDGCWPAAKANGMIFSVIDRRVFQHHDSSADVTVRSPRVRLGRAGGAGRRRDGPRECLAMISHAREAVRRNAPPTRPLNRL